MCLTHIQYLFDYSIDSLLSTLFMAFEKYNCQLENSFEYLCDLFL